MDDRELKILEDLKEGPIRLRSGLITKYRYNEKKEFYIVLSNLKEKGLNIKLIEQSPHILPFFDSDIVSFVEKELD